MNTFDGYIRRDGTNSKVLLDGGDVKALSSFIGTISYTNNKITYTKADGTSYDLVDLSNYIYNLRVATSDNLGGIRIGFSQSGKNYPVQLDSNNKAYVYVPWEENSHYTTRLYVGDGTAENKITTNGSTKITVTDNNNVRNYITLIGSGATTVSSDDNGKITINSINTTYNTGDSATLNKGTNTEGKLWSAKTLVDYISDILGVDSTAITSLNTLIGLLNDNDTATGILVELAKKLNTPSSSIGSNNQPIYWNGSSFTTIGYTIEKSVPSNAIFTDTKYSFYVGENNNIKEHKNVSNPYFKLFENNTPTSIQIKAGTGISVSSDDSGNITITNNSPDQNHNTDKTGIKLGTISGTKKTDSTVIINNSSTGLTIAGGTNKFSIGDGTNYIEIPITPSFTVTNKDSTIGTSLTTIATIAGTDIKAKIDSYLPLSGGIMTGNLILKGDTSSDMTYSGNIHPFIRFDNINSSLNVSLIFTDYDNYRLPAGIKLVGNLGHEWFEAPTIYQNGTKVAVEGHTHNRLSSQGIMNPETGRTSARGGVYSYNTDASHNTGAPAKYTSIIGFGRGTGGQGEISINWVEGSSTYTKGIWYRGLRDYLDNWYGWTHILDEHNTYISNGTITINGKTITPITSLSGYATEQFVTNKLSSVLDIKIVTNLPTTDINTKTLYLMSAGSAGTNDLYKEYVYINKGTRENPNWDWEILGTVHLNYSDLVTAISFSNNKLLWKKGSTDLTGITIGYATASSVINNTWERGNDCLIKFNNYRSLTRIFIYDSNSTNSPSASGWITAHGWLTADRGVLLALNFDQGEAGRLYTNSQISNGLTGWTGWKKVAWTSDIPTKSSWNYDDRYLKLSGGTLTGHLTIKTSAYRDLLTIYRNENNNNSVINFSNKDGFLGAIGFTGLGQTGMPEKPHVVLKDGTLYTLLHSGNSSVSKSGETLTVNIGGTSYSLTNTNTWRGITDSYSGTDSTISLSLKGGNDLYNALLNGYASSAGNADTVDGYHYNNLPYLPISGGTLKGNISFSGDNNITWSRNTNSAKIHFKNTGDSDSDSYLGFETSDNGNEYFKFGHTSDNAYTEWMSIKSDGVRVKGTKVSLEGHTHSYLSTTTKYAAGNSVGGSANYLRWESAESSSYARKIPISWADDVETTTTRFRATYSNSLTYRTDTNTISSNISGKAASAGSADSADKIKSRGNLVYYEEGSTTKGESGVNLYTVYNNGYPATYGNLLHINGLGAGQILAEWCGNSTLGHLYYRSKRDNHYNGWSAWGKVAFTTDNVASASNATNATYANYLNLVASNEIRFNNIPSSLTNICFNYVWAGGIADDKISNYLFMNGNRGYAGIVAEQLSCTNGYIYLHGPGTGTYNLSSIFSNSSGLTIETPRATNALNGTVLPLMVKTRGGQWSELQTGTIVANGNVTATAFYASSDLRLKNILTHPNYSAEQLASLPLVKYTWKDKENDSIHLGSIAQNVEEDFAELVNTDNEGYKSLDYATLGAIGVISLAREIVELKKEIKELKSKLYGN